MNRNSQSGESILPGIIVLAVLFIIVATLPKEGNETLNERIGSPTLYTYSSDDVGGGSSIAPGTQVRTAPQAQYISISTGNAAYAYQSYEEYITIENRGDTPINITGWQLRNGKDRRSYNYAGNLQRFSADIAIIPQATLDLPITGSPIMRDVVLEKNERAIVTTGSVGNRYPYQITSFKENMCTGYIEALPEYTFNPALSRNCPRPSQEAGFNSLDRSCRDIISSLGTCQTPEIGGKDREGNTCHNCINGREVSTSCRQFIEEHFSYKGCVAYHSSNPNFYSKTWRVFLGRGWEMWADDYETIELFNQYGQLVDFRNY